MGAKRMIRLARRPAESAQVIYLDSAQSVQRLLLTVLFLSVAFDSAQSVQ
jgi:hypothetical protein